MPHCLLPLRWSCRLLLLLLPRQLCHLVVELVHWQKVPAAAAPAPARPAQPRTDTVQDNAAGRGMHTQEDIRRGRLLLGHCQLPPPQRGVAAVGMPREVDTHNAGSTAGGNQDIPAEAVGAGLPLHHPPRLAASDTDHSVEVSAGADGSGRLLVVGRRLAPEEERQVPPAAVPLRSQLPT